jgi:Ca-activated chloride channel homolog
MSGNTSLEAQVMSRRFRIPTLVVAALAAGLVGVHADPPPKKEPPKVDAKKDTPPPDEDITKTVADWGTDKFAGPPTEFRKGNVTVRELDAKALTKTDSGYTIKLPSGAPITTPTVHDGKVYVSGGFHSKEFYCFEASAGKLVWAINLDDDGPSSAVVEDGVCVFNTESCTIFGVDAQTGKLLWSHWLGDPLTSTPTIANGKVFTSYPAGGRGQAEPAKGAKARPPCSHVLACLELKSGKILWQRWLESDVMSAPVAADKELYVTSFAGVVYKFQQEDGKLLSAVRSRATSAPVVVGNQVYLTRRADDGKGKAEEQIAGVGRDDGKTNVEGTKKEAGYIDSTVQGRTALTEAAKALDASNGFAGGAPATANADAGLFNIGQGSVSTLQSFQGSRLLNFADRNFNTMGDEVMCSDPKTGKCLWSFKLDGDLKKHGGFMGAPPAAAGGQVFLATLSGDVLQMDPETGKLTKAYKVGSQVRQQPAIVDGKIFVGTQDGKLVVIDTGDKKFTGWTTWGGNSAHSGVVAPPAKGK